MHILHEVHILNVLLHHYCTFPANAYHYKYFLLFVHENTPALLL